MGLSVSETFDAETPRLADDHSHYEPVGNCFYKNSRFEHRHANDTSFRHVLVPVEIHEEIIGFETLEAGHVFVVSPNGSLQ